MKTTRRNFLKGLFATPPTILIFTEISPFLGKHSPIYGRASYYWTGAVNNDFYNTQNWSMTENGLYTPRKPPDKTSNIIIQTFAKWKNKHIEAKSLTIKHGAQLDARKNSSMKLHGNFNKPINATVYMAGSGTVDLKGNQIDGVIL
jgi:hypothetical protein